MGNDNAKLVVTNDQGYLSEGEKHPHSWSIIDENELIKWF